MLVNTAAIKAATKRLFFEMCEAWFIELISFTDSDITLAIEVLAGRTLGFSAIFIAIGASGASIFVFVFLLAAALFAVFFGAVALFSATLSLSSK